MQIKRPRDLTLRDLPAIESPFAAAPKAASLAHQIGTPFRWDRSLVQDSPFEPTLSDHQAIERLEKKLKNGELLLVHGVTDGKPFSPVVSWKANAHLPGRWQVDRPLSGLNLESQVARLNDWQITPEQISHLGPGGVGHLSANSFDNDLRAQETEKRERAKQDSQKNLELPVGAAAAVAPVVAKAAGSSGNVKQRKKLHIEVGIFTDGTLNNSENSEAFREEAKKKCLNAFQNNEINKAQCENRLASLLDASYSNENTNVAKLRDLYQEETETNDECDITRLHVYSEGVGTTTGSEDSGWDSATGLGNTGVIEQVKRAFSALARKIGNLEGKTRLDRLTIDLFGFSRGAAAARHISNEIALGERGLMGKEFSQLGIQWPKDISIRFVGLFDTVAGIVNILDGDFHASDEITSPVDVFLDHQAVTSAVHLVAEDECRENFALNSLLDKTESVPANFREIVVPGVHSDVGGGYRDEGTEEVLIHPTLTVKGQRTESPEQTMEWDNLLTEQKSVLDANWIGQYSLPLPSGEPSRIAIEKTKDTNPPPFGKIKLDLTMKRHLKGTYSRVNLYLMHLLARKAGVPLKKIDRTDAETKLPEELISIHQSLEEQILSGNNKPKIDKQQSHLLKQRYIHHSDKYNPTKLSSNFKIEVPFGESFAPFRPAPKRKRLIHLNIRNK